MKLLRVSISVFVVACAANAWAQYGLYGAPDLVRLQPATSAPEGFVAPSGYQTEPPANGAPLNVAYSPATTNYAQPVENQMSPAPATPAPPVPAAYPNSPSGYTPGFAVSNAPNNNAGCGVYSGPVNQYQQQACSEACNGCDTCCQWYGSVLGLAMTRDCNNKLWLSAQSNSPSNQIMNTQEAGTNWEWGGEIRFGRYFCCKEYAIEATYWGIHDMTGSACAAVPGGYVNTPLQDQLMYFNGLGANLWFDGAQEHTLYRTDEVQNVEVNVMRNHLLGECGCPLNVDLCAGIRYFRFSDSLCWGTLAGGCTWGENGGADEAFINDQVVNNLVGGQIGFNVEYQACCGLKFFVTPKFGIYDNIMCNDFRANLGDGTVATQNTYPGMCYPVHSTGNQLSFLTQLDVGADWQITQRLSARFGYRVLAATGMGLADNQIPMYLNDIPTIQDINRNGSLVLHGAFAGLTYCF